MSEETKYTLPELPDIPNNETLIPIKSRKVYEFAYERFLNWAQEQDAYNYSENVMLAYFTHLAEKMKSSSLWAQYSMIKAELNVKHDVNIENYTKLLAFLKRQSEGYIPKKSRVLTRKQFDDFLRNAPNKTHLAAKVILIFGVTGACHCDELLQITADDIDDFGKLVFVKISNSSNTKRSRSFTIIGDFYLNIYREYAALRPKDLNTSRFFIKYQNGQCHRLVIGIHKITSVPREIASYLKLPNPTEYTGHCFRRTSASFPNAEDIPPLKRHRLWRSGSIPEDFTDESTASEKQIEIKVLPPFDYDEPSTCTEMNSSHVDLNNELPLKSYNSPPQYAGNIRQTSVDNCGDILSLKRQRGWKDAGCKEEFVANENSDTFRNVENQNSESHLKLSNSPEHAGNRLQETSATFLVDNCGNVSSSKRQRGWKPSEDVIRNEKPPEAAISFAGAKRNASDAFVNMDQNNKSARSVIMDHFDKIFNVDTGSASSGLNIQNCTIQNCTFNITVTNRISKD